MFEYHSIINISEPLAYLSTRLSECTLETAMLDPVVLLQDHIEQHLMGFTAQPNNLSSHLCGYMTTDILNEVVDTTHDLIHLCFYKFNIELDGDTVVGVRCSGDDAYLLVERTEYIEQMANEYAESQNY